MEKKGAFGIPSWIIVILVLALLLFFLYWIGFKKNIIDGVFAGI
ncbi:MAG TPA: hypothetical protein VJG30_02985 [Candidatus Nanoarchaeia archaeon]|nr:hypothetical protein [Candidatus Nanoarchaeia archaeon]